MAKKASAGGGDYKPSVITTAIQKIEDLHGELESERGKFMLKCRRIRERMDGEYEAADGKGIPKKELRAAIRVRAKRSAAQLELDRLEPDVREGVKTILQAFGDAADLPLFISVATRASRDEGLALQ